MANDNPAEMTNQDLENDMQQHPVKTSGDQEQVKTTSAAEGTLKTPQQDAHSIMNLGRASGGNEEDDPDDLVHSRAAEADSQDGSLPDPEDAGDWESNDDDVNKISS